MNSSEQESTVDVTHIEVESRRHVATSTDGDHRSYDNSRAMLQPSATVLQAATAEFVTVGDRAVTVADDLATGDDIAVIDADGVVTVDLACCKSA